MINFKRISSKIFSILKGHGCKIKMYTNVGQETVDPEESRSFYVIEPNMMVSIDEENNEIKLSKNSMVPLESYESILKQVKNVAKLNMLNFTMRNFGKVIEPKDFSYQASKKKKEQKDMKKIAESVESGSTMSVTNSNGVKFNVRVVKKGDKYGLNNALTNEKDEPLVEFYDARYPHTEYGQFVSRYYLSTILNSNSGIQLDGGVDDWFVDRSNIVQIQGWLSDVCGSEECGAYAQKHKEFWDNFGKKKVEESTFSKMKGSKKTSVQTLENVKIIVKHKRPVQEEVRGARSRQIKAIFLEKAGERFRFPHNHLAGARAMARHMQHGGSMNDVVGEHIISSVSNYTKLVEFYRYARANKLINETTQDTLKLVRESVQSLITEMKRLAGSTTYVMERAKIEEQNDVSITSAEADSTLLKDMFTVKRFDEKFNEVLPIINTLVENNKMLLTRIQEASEQPIVCTDVSVLKEDPVVQYSSSAVKTGNQIVELSTRMVENKELASFISKVGQKLIAEQKLSDFEFGIVKNVLSNVVVETKKEDVKIGLAESVLDKLVSRMDLMESSFVLSHLEEKGDTYAGRGYRLAYSMDNNGQKTIVVQTKNGSFSIQTNQNLPNIHNNRIPLNSPEAMQEITDHVSNYGTNRDKQILASIPKSESVMEEGDVSDSDVMQLMRNLGLKLKDIIGKVKSGLGEAEGEDVYIDPELERDLGHAVFRFEAAKKGMGIVNRLKNPEEKRKHRSRVMKNLNILRSILLSLERSIEQGQEMRYMRKHRYEKPE